MSVLDGETEGYLATLTTNAAATTRKSHSAQTAVKASIGYDAFTK